VVDAERRKVLRNRAEHVVDLVGVCTRNLDGFVAQPLSTVTSSLITAM
jgi:hypothetical protein